MLLCTIDIVVLGGICEKWKAMDSCEIFSVEIGEWKQLPSMNKKRSSNPGTVVAQHGGSHRIFVFGGYDGFQPLNCCEYYETGANEWTMVEAKMTVHRYFLSASLLNHNTVIICGGNDKNDEPLTSCELFDLVDLTFDSFPDMIEARYAHAAVNYNDTVVVMGARDMKTCELFDASANKWISFPSLNENHSFFGAAVIDEKIFVAGGSTDSVEVYDGSAWTVVTKLIVRRFNSSAVNLDGKLVVLGGDREEVDVFDPATGEWSNLPKMITSTRQSPVAVSYL